MDKASELQIYSRIVMPLTLLALVLVIFDHVALERVPMAACRADQVGSLYPADRPQFIPKRNTMTLFACHDDGDPYSHCSRVRVPTALHYDRDCKHGNEMIGWFFNTELRLVDLKKSFGSTTVIHGVDLEVRDGKFVVFVGPSGCGKSTLLQTIAGLDEATSGDILIGWRSVTGVPASDRGLAMVFQSYALYPHMSVYDNMAFALENMGLKRSEIDLRVRWAAQVLCLEDLLNRKPKGMSGGQRQRVAIGRAIVRDPKIFLFDEPLSNLDAELRVATRRELARGLHWFAADELHARPGFRTRRHSNREARSHIVGTYAEHG
jgi:ABC-type nitrate/sulfonate/bicarbonate transport system ATPase subunit